MKKVLLVTLACLAIGIALRAQDDRNITAAALKSVTVYRSGAEMLHTATATLNGGNNELIIDNLSREVDINSIQIKAPSSVTILSVEFSNNFLPATQKTPRIKLLEDSLEHTQKEYDKTALSVTNTNDLLDVLKSNRDIKGTQSGLSVAELMKLMDYYKTKSAELQNDLQQLNEKNRKTSEQLAKIKAQLAEEQKRNTSTAGRLVLQLSATEKGKFDFTISYIAANAYWVPFYDVRVADIKSPLKLVARAKIVQTTGIDWKQVKLSLSTSLPSQWGNAPVLKSWFLGYIDPVAMMDKDLAANSIQSFSKKSALLEDVVVTGYGAQKQKDEASESIRGVASAADTKPLYVVNGAVMSEQEFAKLNPSSIKKMDVLHDASATAMYGSQGANGVVVVTLKDGLEDYVSVADNALNLNFDIDMPYDVPTNGKEQTATIQTYDVNALYKYYAVPALDKDAYLLAEIPGWEKLNLLPGEANIIFEGTYVGKSFIDPNSTSDTMNLTLGRDKRVAVKREKLVDYSSVKFLGSNKLQKFTYELTIKNNKKEAINILLKDQFPLSTNKEIEVSLINTDGAEVNSDLGVLNWKLALAAGESRKISFSYSVKYPKDKLLNLN